MPYISPPAGPVVGRLSHDRCEAEPTRPSGEDTDPKLHTRLRAVQRPPTVMSLTGLPSFPPKGVGEWSGCPVWVRVHMRASVCVYVCARVRVRAGAPCDPVESIRYFFFPSYNSVNSLLLAASKQTGKTKPRRFLIYHLAQSSMFHQPP